MSVDHARRRTCCILAALVDVALVWSGQGLGTFHASGALQSGSPLANLDVLRRDAAIVNKVHPV